MSGVFYYTNFEILELGNWEIAFMRSCLSHSEISNIPGIAELKKFPNFPIPKSMFYLSNICPIMFVFKHDQK
jgi:hypothetical protein